jgi:hypothetical protein
MFVAVLCTDVFHSTFTFWRFSMRIPLGSDEMKVHYSLNRGQRLEFFVPGRHQNMRWAGYSVGLMFPYAMTYVLNAP